MVGLLIFHLLFPMASRFFPIHPPARVTASPRELSQPADPSTLPEGVQSTSRVSGAGKGRPGNPHWFGESLSYSVKWGFIRVGGATMTSTDAVKMNGRPAFHITSTAVSSKFIDAFYKVRDFNESWVDAETLGSMGYSKKIREGRYSRDEWAVFFPRHKKAVFQVRRRDGKPRTGMTTIPGQVQDVLSSLYYIRSQNLAVGKEFILDVNTKANWPLKVRVLKKEVIKVPAGSYTCYVVEPFLRKEGIFVQKGRRLLVWLTADDRKIPVHMEVEVLFGHVSASLLGTHIKN